MEKEANSFLRASSQSSSFHCCDKINKDTIEDVHVFTSLFIKGFSYINRIKRVGDGERGNDSNVYYLLCQ